jgi:hypothetical protein
MKRRGVWAVALLGASFAHIVAAKNAAASAFQWIQTQTLVGADTTFGSAVAISGDTAVIGVPGADTAYVFVRSGTQWTQQQALVPADGAVNSSFGQAVAISGDSIVVGAPAGSSAAYVFVRSGVTWTQQARLVDDATIQGFGSSVAISADTIVVGTYSSPTRATGAAVFVRSAATWSLQQDLPDPEGADWPSWFGTALAIAGDTIVVGAPLALDNTDYSHGAAYVYVRSGASWTGTAQIFNPASNASSPVDAQFFGYSLGLAGGALGVYSLNGVFVYSGSGANWTLAQTAQGCGSAVAASDSLVVAGNCVFSQSAAGIALDETDLPAASAVESGGTAAVSDDTILIGGVTAGTVIVETALIPDAYACGSDGDCVNGHCVSGVCCHTACANLCLDGFCCDGPCTGQCEACDLPGLQGTCSPVAGAPHGQRPACTNAGTACGGSCDGTQRTSCLYPPSSVECGSTCSNGEEADSFCDGQGGCQAQAPHSCNNLVCADAAACKTACSTNADCLIGLACGAGGACGPAATCSGHVSRRADGSTQECSPFECDTTGLCKTSCASATDCTTPNACDLSGRCGSLPSRSAPSGCSVGGAVVLPRGDAVLVWVTSAAWLAVGTRRRRRAQKS